MRDYSVHFIGMYFSCVRYALSLRIAELKGRAAEVWVCYILCRRLTDCGGMTNPGIWDYVCLLQVSACYIYYLRRVCRVKGFCKGKFVLEINDMECLLCHIVFLSVAGRFVPIMGSPFFIFFYIFPFSHYCRPWMNAKRFVIVSSPAWSTYVPRFTKLVFNYFIKKSMSCITYHANDIKRIAAIDWTSATYCSIPISAPFEQVNFRDHRCTVIMNYHL